MNDNYRFAEFCIEHNGCWKKWPILLFCHSTAYSFIDEVDELKRK